MIKTLSVSIVLLICACSTNLPKQDNVESDFVRLVKPEISNYARHEISGYYSTDDPHEAVFGFHVWSSDSARFIVELRYTWDQNSKTWKYDKWMREP